jgi:hypothetical protein
VDANPQISSRSGSVSVNGQRAAIAQTGRPCTFDLSSGSAQIEPGGGSGSITVSTLTGCSWRPTTNVPWIQVPSAAVTGTGRFEFQVAGNDAGERVGIITVADKQFVVSQAAAAPAGLGPGPIPPPLPNCTPTVTPLTIDTSSAASTQTIQLSLGPTCAWSATTAVPWLTITSPASGTGSAVVTLAVAANTGAARSGTLTVANQAVTVRQTAVACTFVLNPTSQAFPSGGGGGRFTVTAPAGCGWSASKSVAWIDVAQGSGNGTGDVTFNVQPNTSTAARSGSITVAGQAFSISQAAAPCAYSLNPASLNVAVEGGHQRFTVTTSSGCPWTAVSNAPWLEVANQSGTGTGDVNINVAANPTTSPRSGTITVNGQTFTVNQAAVSCTFSLNPTSANVAAAAATGTFTVTTQAGCSWTAVSAAAWVTVTAPPSGAGAGTADVSYSVQTNPDPSTRSTTITVGNQSFTINQAAAAAPPPPPPPACTYTLDPTSASVGAAGAGGTFTVTTQSNCVWTATTTDAWITVSNTGSTTGSGAVTYSVQPNATGAGRSGSISVSGQTFAVTQAGS